MDTEKLRYTLESLKCRVGSITEKIRSALGIKEAPLRCSAVILAAGSSVRMGRDKVEILTGGEPVVARTVRAFEESELIDEIVLVTREDRVEELAGVVSAQGFKKIKSVVAGGKTRQDSSLAGVLAVNPKAKLIAIHDCARPFVTQKIIQDTVRAAHESYAALPVIACSDTMKIKDGNFLGDTVDRDRLCRVQTPQVFRSDLIKGALTYVVKNHLPVTDDSSALAYLGFRTRAVQGDPDNIKLTTPEDMFFAEAIIGKRQSLSGVTA